MSTFGIIISLAQVSPKSKTLLIISISSSSIMPSSWLTPTKVLSSSSVIDLEFKLTLTLKSFKNKLENKFKTKIIGVSTTIKKLIGLA